MALLHSLRMPFGRLLGRRRLFSKRAIDIILQPVIGRFRVRFCHGRCYYNISIVQRPCRSFARVFTLLRDAGLTLNKGKMSRHYVEDKLKYLGLIISKEGIETDNKKFRQLRK
ncbi:hypothetical protein TNCV_1452391 [Trichonephila clavipes]|nr:hypothetical protein TNCV_1452391 [Trichonephila clavipes]